MPIGIRRQARMIALQTLYEYDTAQHTPSEVLQRHVEDRHLQPKVAEYASELVIGVYDHLADIDAHIQSAAREWPIQQMARIDKNILRLAIYEILFNNTEPTKEAINEAVELIMSLEEEFKLQISDEDAEKITTVQEAEDYIEEHLR